MRVQPLFEYLAHQRQLMHMHMAIDIIGSTTKMFFELRHGPIKMLTQNETEGLLVETLSKKLKPTGKRRGLGANG